MYRQLVVLVGGLGTRLGALTQQVPKPMLPIGETPFLDILLRNFVRFGFDDILLLARYHADVVEAHYAENPVPGASVRVLAESEPAGTGGALREAAPYLAETFVLTNGDSLFDFNFLALCQVQQATQADAVLSLCRVEDVSRYGSVTLGSDGLVTGYAEKIATPGQSGLISGGVYAMSRRVLERIGPGQVSLETDVLPGLVDDGLVRGAPFEGYFIDIGLPESYARAQSEIPAWSRRRVVFFDRDGTLNRDEGYTHKPEDLEFLPGAVDAIRRCNDAGRLVIVVTNQAGIARGYYSAQSMELFHKEMNRQLAAHGAHIDAFYHCPHHPDGTVPDLAIQCSCRKPGVALFQQAADEWSLDLEGAVMIGDRETDLDAARAFGITPQRTTGADLDDIIRKLTI